MTGWPDPQPQQPEAPAPKRDTTAQGLAVLGFIVFIASVWVRDGADTALPIAALILVALSITLSIRQRIHDRGRK